MHVPMAFCQLLVGDDIANRQYSYYRYWTSGTSLQLRLMQGVFSNANVSLFNDIPLHEPPLQAPVQYKECEYGVLDCGLIEVQPVDHAVRELQCFQPFSFNTST